MGTQIRVQGAGEHGFRQYPGQGQQVGSAVDFQHPFQGLRKLLPEGDVVLGGVAHGPAAVLGPYRAVAPGKALQNLAKLPHVKSISGIGLMVGIEFYDLKAADVLAACREAGLLVLTAKTRLRLLPPLTLSEHDVDMALEILGDVLSKMEPTAPKEQA